MLTVLASAFKTSAQLRLENIALRHQLVVVRRSTPKRLKLSTADRIFWLWLRRVWAEGGEPGNVAVYEACVGRSGFDLGKRPLGTDKVADHQTPHSVWFVVKLADTRAMGPGIKSEDDARGGVE